MKLYCSHSLIIIYLGIVITLQNQYLPILHLSSYFGKVE